MKHRVFVTRPIPEVALRLLQPHCDVILRDEPLPPTKAELMDGLRDADGVLCLLTDPISEDVIAAAPKLRIISNMAVGYNNIDVAAATQRGIWVGNTPGVLTEATADLAFALLIAAARCVRTGLNDISDKKWRTWEPLGYLGQELTGKTLGIIGLGRIGTALARRCRFGWNMRVLYHNPRPNRDAEKELDAKLVDLDTLLRESDFVSLHCPATSTNKHLMSHEQFRKMKPSAVLVNTARGSLVEQTALEQALRENWIFAAGIDVTDPEPPDPEDRLLRLPNLIVMPHIASATQETRDKMAKLAAENLLAGLAGQPLPHWVNPEVQANRAPIRNSGATPL